MLTIALWLWQEPGRQKKWGCFTVDHVNRAAAMIRANLDMQHEIVCITDQPDADFDSRIRVIELWPELADAGRCWRRLKAFSPEMAELIGPRFVWVDLDVVVTGDLTPLFDRPEDIVFWQSQTTRCPINGSLILMTAGCRPQVWSTFELGKHFEPRYPGTDQAWISHVLGLGNAGASEAMWTAQDGVVAYNRHCRKTLCPPPFARLIAFPGTVKPNADIVRIQTPWVQEILDSYWALPEDDYRWEPRRTSKLQMKMHKRQRLQQRLALRRERRGVVVRGA